MIHAYLFINNIREENGGHGPNFKRIMTEINRKAGTNITVYHTFHDEVELYKTHWWRCNGLCQHRRPFFGYVRRTCNRAPGPNDRWWYQHQKTCSGTFEKIKEPEPKRKKSEAKKNQSKPVNSGGDIRKHFGGVRGGLSNRGGNTMVIRKPPQTQTSPIVIGTPPKKASGNLSNVVGFRDLTGSSPQNSHKKTNTPLFTGVGQSLSQASQSTSISDRNVTPESVRQSLRDIWNTRFAAPSPKLKSVDLEKPSEEKQTKVIETRLDDDLVMYEPRHSCIDITDSDEEYSGNVINITEPTATVIKKETPAERQKSLLDDIRNSDDEDDDIQLIDDEFDDTMMAISVIADSDVVDELFGGDDTWPSNPSTSRPNSLIACPLCQEYMPRDELDSHLEGCQGVQVQIKKPSLSVLDKITKEEKKKKKTKKKTPFDYGTPASRAAEMKRALLQAGYQPDEIRGVLEHSFDQRTLRDVIPSNRMQPPRKIPKSSSSTNMNSNSIQSVSINSPPERSEPNETSFNGATSAENETSPTVICPVCEQPQSGDINAHLDVCLM